MIFVVFVVSIVFVSLAAQPHRCGTACTRGAGEAGRDDLLRALRRLSRSAARGRLRPPRSLAASSLPLGTIYRFLICSSGSVSLCRSTSRARCRQQTADVTAFPQVEQVARWTDGTSARARAAEGNPDTSPEAVRSPASRKSKSKVRVKGEAKGDRPEPLTFDLPL